MRLIFSTILVLVLGIIYPFAIPAQQTNTSGHTIEKGPDSIEISAYDNRIVVKNAPVGSTLEIYSVVGVRVKEIKMKQSSGEYPVDIAKGYYIIRIKETVRKIAIR